jgi:hypothetical protein
MDAMLNGARPERRTEHSRITLALQNPAEAIGARDALLRTECSAHCSDDVAQGLPPW